MRSPSVIRPLSVLWEQCSLQVWAIVSSSMSVGSRPSFAEVRLNRLHLVERQGQLAGSAQIDELPVVDACGSGR